MADNGVLC